MVWDKTSCMMKTGKHLYLVVDYLYNMNTNSLTLYTSLKQIILLAHG